MSQPWHGGTRAGLRSQLQPQSRGCCALSSAHPLRIPQPLARAQHGLGFSTTQRDFSFLALRQSSSAPRSSTGIPSQLGCTGQLRGCWKGAAPPSPGPLKFGGFQAEGSSEGLAPRRARGGGAGRTRRGNLACHGAGWDTLQECLPAPTTAGSLPQHPAAHPRHSGEGVCGPLPLSQAGLGRAPASRSRHGLGYPRGAPQQAQRPQNGPGNRSPLTSC